MRRRNAHRPFSTTSKPISQLLRPPEHEASPEHVINEASMASCSNSRRARELVPRISVYPRTRGDHMIAATAPSPSFGLPPLTRGSPLAGRLVPRVDRSTPAHAGITRSRPRRGPSPRVYPRTHGDHTGNIEHWVFFHGLPPPTRGSPCDGLLPSGLLRSTPAHAGITSRHRRSDRLPRVYPRLRGDHRYAAMNYQDPAGLPPHTRGSHVLLVRVVHEPRSTPACAGIT